MVTKKICLHCKTYSTYDKEHNCYICKTDNVLETGSAFRLPKKSDTTAWQELYEIFTLQRANPISPVHQQAQFNKFLFGFGNNAGYHGMMTTRNVSRKVKERAALEGIKAAYSRPKYK